MDAEERVVEALRQRVLASGQVPAAPATPEQIASAEARLGFEIPNLWRLLLLRVGNGEFGPYGGFLGVRIGFTVNQWETAEESYFRRRSAEPAWGWTWPYSWLPICNDGCGLVYCVECLAEGFPVILIDPNGCGDDGKYPIMRRVGSLHDWLASWAAEEQSPYWGNS
jgi:SMI1/KNR4 family protein SUKH-1